MYKLKKKHLSQAVKKRYSIYGPPKLTAALREASKQLMAKMSLEDKRALSHLAIKAKGQVPWDEKETSQFLRMCGQKNISI
ncbi:MAG: hypothetical protein GWM89_11260 [Candidatus Dadabacteria bacterium]|nr:hypothetical protein [Candidatus Dadabacteria bacterium]NIX16382.1 hypothetical protein [Candidatus Dadabacteria bacterium]NIY22972.1 hypothetical protein [Candidatus Dadabacteria bacterium]